LVWGLLLIFFGVVALIKTYFDIRAVGWVSLFAGAGLVIFIIYLTDRARWGLLIPAYVMWAVAGLIAIAEWELIADEFIPAYVMLAIAVMLPLTEYNVMSDELIATYVLTAIALPFLAIFLRDRKQWWALIPAYIMLVIGAMLPMIEGHVLAGGFIATYVLTVIALPFVLVFVLDTERWWALIPAYVLMAVGVMVWLIDAAVLTGVGIPAYIAFAIAIPFFVVFVRNHRERWPLIPALIGAGTGLVFLVAETFARYIVPAALIIVGGGLLLLQFTRRGEPAVIEEPPDRTTPKPSV
jgi:hypothetical protein